MALLPRCLALLALAIHVPAVRGTLRASTRRSMEDPAPVAVGKPTYDLDGFKTEWHKEWRHGDFPDWKTEKNYANYYVDKGFEDKQSDQKATPVYGNMEFADPKTNRQTALLVHKLVKEDPAPVAVGKPTYDLDGFKTEWHKEWRHGDFPDWKTEKNYANYYVDKGFEDKQSDQKATPVYGNMEFADPKTNRQTALLAHKSVKEDPAPVAVGKPTYDLDGFKTEWHKEWRHGDFPDWKTEKNYANYYVDKGFEDKQSDQKATPVYGNMKFADPNTNPQTALLTHTSVKQDPAPATPAPGGEMPKDPEYNHDLFNEEWHDEWRNGDYPGYKITNPEAARFEDRQSDGKQSPPGRSKDYEA